MKFRPLLSPFFLLAMGATSLVAGFDALAQQADLAVGQPEFPVIARLDVGDAPHGMQLEGNRLYLAAAGDNKIQVIKLDDLTIEDAFAVDDTPLDLIRAGDGWLVTSFRSNLVTWFSDAGEPGKSWNVGPGPSLFAPRAVGDLVYLVSEFDDRFTVLNRKTLSLTASYKTGDRPYPGDVTADGVLAFIPNRDEDTVSVIDLLNGEEVARTPVCHQPEGGALGVDDVNYFVACGGGDRVMAINTASFKVVAEISEGIGPRPFSVVTSRDGRWAFVNNAGGSSVSVIDLKSLEVIERIAVGDKPIVMREGNGQLFVAAEGSNTVSIINLPEPPVLDSDLKNEVVVLGMIHGTFRTSERYSLEVLRQTIRNINPDYIVTEIPPNRLEAAMRGFKAGGRVSERRVSVFPEYVDVVFPLTREMDFEIVPAAAWNSYMNKYRSAALKRIAADPERADEWAEYRAALAEMSESYGARADDPLFIHTDEYDGITRRGLEPYDRLFNDELGTGGWTTINAAHYALIEKALDARKGEGVRILITFGAGHKYRILSELRKRDDIELLDPRDFFPVAKGDQ